MRPLKMMVFVLLLGTASVITAQETCPALVQEAFTATELICEGMGPNQTCLGNGVVEATSVVEGFQFAQPGDITTTTDFQTLRLRSLNTENAVWAVIVLKLTVQGGNITGLIFGDVSLTNTATASASAIPTLQGTVIATGGINVRRTPDTGGVVVWQLLTNETVLVTGKTADNAWYRIEIPSQFGGPGWVSAQWLQVEGDSNTLRLVTSASPAPDIKPPEFGPMQVFNFQSSITDESCEDTPNSGILLQTPDGLPADIKLRINNATIEFNGTIFLTAQSADMLTINVLEGAAKVTSNDQIRQAPAGSAVAVPINTDLTVIGAPENAEYDAADFFNLPIRLLPRNFGIAETSESGATSGSTSANSGTGSTTTGSGGACILTAVDADKNLRGGPATTFPQTGTLRAGESVTAVGQVRDQFQYTWYQTVDGDWIRYDIVTSSPECADLPGVVPPAAPASVEPTPVPAGQPALAPANQSLFNQGVGDACQLGAITLSRISDGTNASISIGDIWVASAGTTATFLTNGGSPRDEFSDFIRVVDAETGAIIAQSGNSRTLTVTFQQPTYFVLRFVARKDDAVSVTASCN